MKIKIEATQEEFDSKRGALIKALAGDKFTVALKPKGSDHFYKWEKELFDRWTIEYEKTIAEIKDAVGKVLDEAINEKEV